MSLYWVQISSSNLCCDVNHSVTLVTVIYGGFYGPSAFQLCPISSHVLPTTMLFLCKPAICFDKAKRRSGTSSVLIALPKLPVLKIRRFKTTSPSSSRQTSLQKSKAAQLSGGKRSSWGAVRVSSNVSACKHDTQLLRPGWDRAQAQLDSIDGLTRIHSATDVKTDSQTWLASCPLKPPK